jgi:hypothetical protein
MGKEGLHRFVVAAPEGRERKNGDDEESTLIGK